MKARTIVEGEPLVFEVDSDGESPQQFVADGEEGASTSSGKSMT